MIMKTYLFNKSMAFCFKEVQNLNVFDKPESIFQVTIKAVHIMQ